jgi:flagellar FliL protein
LATEKNPENKSKFKNIIIVVLALFILMLMTTGVAYVVAKSIAGSNNNSKNIEAHKNHITYDAGEFLTNLSDKGYIKLSLVYLLSDKEVEKQLQIKDSEIRDKIFTILRSKKYDSVRDSDGMEELRGQIKESLNQTLNGTGIIDVYFTSIIVN